MDLQFGALDEQSFAKTPREPKLPVLEGFEKDDVGENKGDEGENQKDSN